MKSKSKIIIFSISLILLISLIVFVIYKNVFNKHSSKSKELEITPNAEIEKIIEKEYGITKEEAIKKVQKQYYSKVPDLKVYTFKASINDNNNYVIEVISCNINVKTVYILDTSSKNINMESRNDAYKC